MGDCYSFWTKVGLALIVLALVLTIVVFRKRWFERGPRPARPADPDKIKQENPPDGRSRNR
jgi:uncharacterized iron-regulated membrane protein